MPLTPWPTHGTEPWDTDATLKGYIDDRYEENSAAIVGKQNAGQVLTDLTTLSATIGDGQLFGWDGTLDEPVAVNPTGAGRIAAARNVTGTATAIPAFTTPATPIAATAINVTNSGGRPVEITFGATFQQTTAGTGTIYLVLSETTSLSPVDKMLFLAPMPGSTTAGSDIVTLAYADDIGVVTNTRVFDLRVFLYSSAVGNILNSTLNPSWVTANAV